MSRGVERQAAWLFRINAIINWTVSIRGILDPIGMAAMFGGPEPTYPFMYGMTEGVGYDLALDEREIERRAVSPISVRFYSEARRWGREGDSGSTIGF